MDKRIIEGIRSSLLGCWRPCWIKTPFLNQRGAILVGLIITLSLAAVMGATMSSLTTTSSYTELATDETQNAYYMAYSGLKFYDKHPTTLPLSSTPLIYTLNNGIQFELAIESDQDGQPRLTSTGVVEGVYGPSQWKVAATGVPGSLSFVDTFEDKDNWSADGDVIGEFFITDVDGNTALEMEGESLADADSGASSDTINKARQLLESTATAIANAFYGGGGPHTATGDVWMDVVSDLQGAASLADAIGIINTELDNLSSGLQLPQEMMEPKAFAAFDWRQADDGNPIPFFDYWKKQNEFANDPPYDHQPQTLSYDVQAKFAIRPELEHYMVGLSMRLDDSIANGGEMLGVSIVRGDKGMTDLIPDALVPVDRTEAYHDPMIVVWSATDTDGNGIVTPKWEVDFPGIGTTQLWPKEREWLVYGMTKDGYCLTDEPNDKYFLDWITLMVRIEEKELTSGIGIFNSGDRVNALKIFLGSVNSCSGGGFPAGNDQFLDNKRGPNPRLPGGSRDIRWPVFDPANFAVWNDNFTMIGGDWLDIDWVMNLSPDTGPTFDVVGQNEEYDSIIMVDAETNPAHSSDSYHSTNPNSWPAEMGLHMFGEGDPDSAAPKIFADDYGVRLEGPDPQIR